MRKFKMKKAERIELAGDGIVCGMVRYDNSD